MFEYTWKNLIYNPTLEEAKNAIGKECYFGATPIGCIKNANDDKNSSVLREVRRNEFSPFITSNYGSYSCIIVKEEPKPKYVPFESAGEFTDAYDCANYSVKNGTVENKLLSYGGIWLKGKVSGFYYMVAEIRSDGVVLAGGQDVIFWSELLKDYVFLDDSSCGRLMEEKHE